MPPKQRGGGGHNGGRRGGSGSSADDFAGKNDPIGRKLVKLLRHRVHENGLSSVLRPDGYVPLDAVLKLQQFGGVTVEMVRDIVASNDKQRMALMEEGGQLFIRANQGHTVAGIQDDALLQPVDAAAAAALGDGRGLAVHGTYHAAWDAIYASGGLKSMARHHIHLAIGLPGDSGVISGMRKSSEVLIWVDVAAAVAAGIPFYTSQNNVILTPGDANGLLPLAHFARVVERTTGREWHDGCWSSLEAQAVSRAGSGGKRGALDEAQGSGAVEPKRSKSDE